MGSTDALHGTKKWPSPLSGKWRTLRAFSKRNFDPPTTLYTREGKRERTRETAARVCAPQRGVQLKTNARASLGVLVFFCCSPLAALPIQVENASGTVTHLGARAQRSGARGSKRVSAVGPAVRAPNSFDILKVQRLFEERTFEERTFESVHF